ncbi:MAG TPA: GIY-YIG nuclease family protein [Meiothermus sp.]|nr:GIY-YIG nuclease family protein [Meiothermus sp.]
MLTNDSQTLYVGMTNDLARRIHEQRDKLIEGFTRRYNITQLVYYEETQDVRTAIEPEKQLKSWSRRKKYDLINSFNPRWRDLGDEVLG